MCFTKVFNLSISASWLVLAVIGLRYLLKNAPKSFRCALWALVAIRLLCPVSIESELSLLPSREMIPESYLYMEPSQQSTPATLEVITNPAYPTDIQIDTGTTVDRVQNWDMYSTLVWFTGMVAMSIYAAYSYLTVRLRVRMAAWIRDQVWECDEVDSPFILGLIRPRIYLPSNLDAETKIHVLAHEQAHIQRLDHLWKPLGFALLTVHWFNPIMWLGYVLLCRDIELACDEHVIRQLDRSAISRYSEALIACSVSHRMIAACPLAFGEVGVSSRIKAMIHYKKPGFWIILIALILSLVLAVCFLTDPVQGASLENILNQKGYDIVDHRMVRESITIFADEWEESWLDGKTHEFLENQIVVWESPTTKIWMKRLTAHENNVNLEFDFSCTLSDSGTLLLPRAILETDGIQKVREDEINPDTYVYTWGPSNEFGVNVPKELIAGAFQVTLTGLYEIRYIRDSSPAAEILGTDWQIAESLYCNAASGGLTADNSMIYSVTDQFTFLDHPESGYWVSVNRLSDLRELELTEENFDRKFSPEFWTGDADAAALRRDNRAAWIFTYADGNNSTMMLLLQKDGSCYLVRSEGGAILEVCRLEPAILEEPQYSPWEKHYTLPGYTEPILSLRSDGVFSMPLNETNGYFVMSDSGLTLNSADGSMSWHFIGNLSGWIYDMDNSHAIVYSLPNGELQILEDGTTLLEMGEENPAYVTYSLAGGDLFAPSFRLCSDGSFTLTTSPLSSYMGFGEYQVADDLLILNTDDGRFTWCFQDTKEGYLFEANKSSAITCLLMDGTTVDIRDGAAFVVQEETIEPDLDTIIEEAIVNHYRKKVTKDHIHVSSYRNLGQMVACGVAPAGGENKSYTTIYALIAYQDFLYDGSGLTSWAEVCTPATITLDGENNVEFLPLGEEHKDLEKHFPDFILEDYYKHDGEYARILRSENAAKADAAYAKLKGILEEAEAEMQDLIRVHLDLIYASRTNFSAPRDCIEKNHDAYMWLFNHPEETIRYCFTEFSRGDQMDLRGHIMALICQDILLRSDSTANIYDYTTGQGWFNLYCEHSERLRENLGDAELERLYPYRAMALNILGI